MSPPSSAIVTTIRKPVNTPRSKGVAAGTADVLPFIRRPARNPVPLIDGGNALLKAVDAPFGLDRLWQAITDDRVVLHYQPQVDVDTGRVIALEALVRIAAEDGALVYPDRYIADAEDSGLIVPLGREVIRQACRDLASWRAAGLSVQRVAINLSAHQLNLDRMLTTAVDEITSANGLTHADLEFELTERQALDRGGPGMKSLRTLAEAGARLALDDFGVGYSSISYLTELPFSVVKIDRSMVAQIPANETTGCVIRHLIAMASELGIEVVGEGVETAAQRDFLLAADCRLMQGYLLSRPGDGMAVLRTYA